MYFFTADEHYGHRNIIKYCNRPFKSVEEMDSEIIRRHNEKVSKNDTTIHAGDFTLSKDRAKAQDYVKRLNGNHVFLRGSHDYWLDNRYHEIWERTIGDTHLVVCHYAMRTWARSHYKSWMLYGHSHGTLDPIGKQHDVGVDNNGFYPVSFEEIKAVMGDRPDNPNFIVKAGR